MSFENNDFGLFKDFPEPVFIIDPSGTILDANAAFASRFFSKVSEIRGLNLFDLIVRVYHDEELSSTRKERIGTVLSTGKHLVFEDESNGRTLRSTVYPVKSADGEISRLLILVHDVTEQKTKELQLQQNDLVFKTLLDAIPGSVFILDEEGLLIACNDHAFDFFGDRKQQIKSRDFFDLVVHEDRERIRNKFHRLLDSGVRFSDSGIEEGSDNGEADEARMFVKDTQNEFRWFMIHARLRIIAGRRCLVIVTIDVNQQKLAEKQLEKYKRWLGMTMDSAKTGVWDWNIKTDAAIWSNRIWSLYGVEKKAGVKPSYKLWENTIHPEDRDLTVNTVRETIRKKVDLHVEYRIIHSDGSVHWMMLSAKPLFDSNGEVKRYYGTAVDVTEQKQVEEEIEITRAHLDFALEKCHIGWWDMNLENYTTVRTLEHARIFGYETLDNKWSFDRFLAHVTDDDRSRVRKIITDSISNKRDFVFECQIVKSDGNIRWIWSSGTLQYDRYGKATHVLGIVQDITDRKRVEKNQERMQHLLQQSQKMEMVGQLAGGIAHDFNNSLTSILGNVEILFSRLDKDSPLAEHIKEIEISAQHSAKLTRQLLMFAQKQLRSPKKVFLDREMKKIIPGLRNLLDPDVKLVWHPCHEEVCVEIDPAELEQLMINFVVNAADAITGNGRIVIETGIVNFDSNHCLIGYPCKAPSDHAMISITDTGSGIEKKALPHIFEPFFTTKSVDKGSGLGLTTAYGILKHNRGCIDCQTETGKGTTFTIYLPLYDELKREKNGDRRTMHPGSSNEAVLLVENDPFILKILGTLLTTSGFYVCSAPDAESALEIAEQHHGNIALLVTDIVLPKMNGVELSERLVSRYPDIKTLYMSGYPLNVLPQNDDISEGVNFIEKPFSITEFKEIVAGLIYGDNHAKPLSNAN
jgi:PAS domain S-box-containing protein